MRSASHRITSMALLAALGCSSEKGTNPSIALIADTYSGQVAGNDQGSVLQGILALDITQAGSNLSGDWSLNATLSSSTGPSSYNVEGTFTGTIGFGDDPTVSVSMVNPICPVYETKFIGKYGTLTKLITLNGALPLYNNGCNASRVYQSTVVLSR